MKKLITLLTAVVLIFGMISCSPPSDPNSTPTTEPGKKIRVGLVLSVGGRGDKSFNDSAYRGLVWARDRLGVEITEGQPKQMAEDDPFDWGKAEEVIDEKKTEGIRKTSSCI